MHPTTRNDAQYEEDKEGQQPAPGVKKSRLLRRERKVELSYKDQEPLHIPLEAFCDEALKKKVLCPKFYSCV